MPKKIIDLFIKDYRWLLFLILSLAALLRFIGTNPGFPPYHSDEGISYSQGISIIKEGTLDAHGYGLPYAYPAVVPLVNAIFFKFVFIPLAWIGFLLTNFDKIVDGFIRLPFSPEEYKRTFQLFIVGEREINALFWTRYITALTGIGVVFLTYLVGKKLFNKEAGLLSALLVAVNWREVLNSHIGLPDIYNAFFLLLAFLAALALWEKPTRERYFIAAVTAGLSFSTKYQFFSFFPLLFVHIDLAFKKGNPIERIRYLFGPGALLVPFVVILVFMLLNPYHLIKWEETIKQVADVSLKYRAGRMMFDFYPYSYLYHFGIGKITSILAILGIFGGLLKYRLKSLLLLSVVLPFFFFMTYYTGGGFYTRNFVTIIPFLLIFAGLVLVWLLNAKLRRLRYLLFALVLLPVVWENISKSVIVTSEYTKPWNFKVLSEWSGQNIPPGSRVTAHSSVPLSIENVTRLPFELDFSFSIEEFREQGADWAIMNLDWATNSFYWWMSQDTKRSLAFWEKPVDALEQMYAAAAIREFSDFAVYAVLNNWQAPDSNFVVAKVPKYEVLDKTLAKHYAFTRLSGSIGWKTEPIFVGDWEGFLIEYRLNTESANKRKRNAFLLASFYQKEEDVGYIRKRIAVRLSSRNSLFGELEEKDFLGQVPEGATYMVIELGAYESSQASAYLEELEIYNADVNLDFGGVKINPIELDNNIVFPNSHGNL